MKKLGKKVKFCKEGDTFSVYGNEYAIDSSGHINVSAEDEFTSTEIKYPSRSIQ